MIVSIKVPGVPQPQGSTRAFPGRGRAAGRIIVTTDNPKLYPWRLAVRASVSRVWRRRAPVLGPMELTMRFVLPRPAGHYKKDGGLRDSAPDRVIVRPDLDKLCRAILDALKTAGVYRDDDQVDYMKATKEYEQRQVDKAFSAIRPGVYIDLHFHETKSRGGRMMGSNYKDSYAVWWDPISGCYRSADLTQTGSGCVHRHRTVVTAAQCAVRRDKTRQEALNHA